MAIGTGDRNVPRTRGQECPRYAAQAFQPAGSGDFPVARPTHAFNQTWLLDSAFKYWLEGLEERQPLALLAIVNSFYKPLWRDPRFDEVLRRAGLDKYFPERMHGPASAKD